MLDLLLIGNITRDRIVSPEGERTATGGAVYYGSLPAALHGIKVGVVTRLSAADHHLLAELEQAGIQITALDGGRTTEIENIARSADFERRRFVVKAVADPFTLDDLESINARRFLICPLVKGEFPVEGLSLLAKRGEVALDVQGFIRCLNGDTLRSSDWVDKEKGLKHVTVLKADQRETEIVTGLSDMDKAARVLLDAGPREVLVTHGRGIHLYTTEGTLSVDFDATEVRGRIGRGDTTIATYLAKRFTAGPKEALEWTGWLVSRKLEQPGPFTGPLNRIPG